MNAQGNSQARVWLSRSGARVSSMSDRLRADCRHGESAAFPLLQQSGFRWDLAVDCKNILHGVNTLALAFKVGPDQNFAE